jgi:hypothetical protein
MKLPFFDSATRGERIQNFIDAELLPETRAELIKLIRMFEWNPHLSENEVMYKYIAESDYAFFKNLITKNHVERRIAEERDKLFKESQLRKETERNKFIEEEARSYISHVIQNIISGEYDEKKYPSEFINLAKQVRNRAEKIVESFI